MTENYLNILAETIRANWNQPALTDFYLSEDGTAQDTSRGNHYTYGEMYAELCRVAELLTSLGLQKGDHIAICGANSAHWVIAYLAIAKMQGVSVTVMHSLMPDEIARLVAFSDAKALFTDEDIWEELLPSFQGEELCSIERPVDGRRISGDRLSSVLSLADWSILHSICSQSRRSTDGQPTVSYNVIATHSKENLLDELVNGNWTNGICPDDLAMICFTSGSTGGAKGIMLSMCNMSNNSQNIIDGYPDVENKLFLSILPMSHIYGFMTEIIGQLLKGKDVRILSSLLTINNLYCAIKITQPYALSMIPQIVSALMDSHADCIELMLRSVQQMYIGGALFDKVQEKQLYAAGVPISIGYGMTETGPLISYSIHPLYRPNTCGKIVSGMTARISPAGEILVKGENVMLGYYKDPEATAAKIDSDGWLHTGDKGHLDEDGYLYVEGRLEQDIIVLPNGENIRPDNIESLINALPEVSESIVLSRDGKLVAIVVPSSESKETSETRASSPSSSLRRTILRAINPSLPLFSQLYDIEITDTPLQKTEKQTLKRYLYK